MYSILLHRMGLFGISRSVRGFILLLTITYFCVFTSDACFDGGSDAEDEVQIVVDGMETFYRLRTVDCDRHDETFAIFSGLSFDPTFLDFGYQPLLHPKRVEVTITNIDADQSVELVTTFGAPRFIFWSRFNQTAIAPSSSAKFNVTFLPYTVGEFEAFMYIQTSLGAVKYQVFGSSYISDQHLLPLVNFESMVENKKVFNIKILNPFTYSVEINSMEVYPRNLQTDHCIRFHASANSIGRNNTISNCFFPSKVLNSFEITNLLKVHTDLDEMELVRISSSPHADDLQCKSGKIEDSTSCVTAENSTDQHLMLPTVLIPINEFPQKVLYSRVNLLYFGTITSQSDPITKPIDILYLGNQTLQITSIESSLHDEAISINITETMISPRTVLPKTIAKISISPKHITHSYHISGVINVFTNDRSIYLPIPFYARLTYGFLSSNVQKIETFTLSSSQQRQRTALLFNFSVTNQYDFVLPLSKPIFPEPINKYLQIHYAAQPMELAPNQTKLIMSLSVLSDDDDVNDTGVPSDNYGGFVSSGVSTFTGTRVRGTASVHSSNTHFLLSYDIYSGRLQVGIQGARLINKTFILGTIQLGETSSHYIVIYNKNPIPIEVKLIEIYTKSANGTQCQFLISRWNTLNRVCHFTRPCQHCVINLADEMPPSSEFNLPLKWGSKKVTQHIKGIIRIHSKYEILRQNFECYITHGRVVVTPDPLIVNNLFPGRSIHRNIIVQNTYSTDINITKVQLHPPNFLLSKIDNDFTKDVVKFHNIKQEIDNDSNLTIHSIQPITFSPNQSVLIGTVNFDVSESCMDHSVTTTNLTTASITSQAVKQYCYCGFSLDTSPGRLWLKGSTNEKTNHCSNESDPQHRINYSLIKETFSVYSELHNRWLKYFTTNDLSKHPVKDNNNNNSNSNSRSHIRNLKNITASLSYEMLNVTFHSDLSIHFIWPELINSQKHSVSSSKKNTTWCIVKEFVSPSATSFNRQIQIPTILSSSGTLNSWECIFQIVNPQSTLKPLFIQPVLWSQVYNSCVSSETQLNDLKTLTTHLFRNRSLVDSLFTTTYGEYSIQPYSCSSRKSKHILNHFYPPSYLLAPDGGEQCFRLTFTPLISNLLYSINPNNNNEGVLRSLLLIRNNLTSVEPIWLEVQLDRIGLTLAKVSTSTASQSSGSVVITDVEKKLHSNLPNFNLYVRSTPGNNNNNAGSGSSQSGIEENVSPSLKIDQIIYEADLSLIGLFNTTTTNNNNNKTDQNFHKYIPLKFEFTEKSIGPFCETPNTDLVRRLHSSLQSRQDKQSGSHHYNYQTTTGHADIDHHKGLLVNLSLRRRLVLVNTGQVTLNIFMLCLLPSTNSKLKSLNNLTDSNISTTLSSLSSSTSMYSSQASCTTAGFKIDPCILPMMTITRNASNNNEKSNNTSDIFKILPGQHLIIELRHYPDFTHTYLTADLIIQVYPSIFESNILQWLNVKESNNQTDNIHDDLMFIQLPIIPLEASFNTYLLGACLNFLPRPPIESFLWIMVLIFYVFNIIGILISSYADAKGIHTNHIALRRHIDESPENFYPDSTKIFSLNQTTEKTCITYCKDVKRDLYDERSTGLVTNLSYSLITTNIATSPSTDHTVSSDIVTTERKLRLKSVLPTSASSISDSGEQKINHQLTTGSSYWNNYYCKWILGLLFLIKHTISLRWIFITIIYPYKTIKQFSICAGKAISWFNSWIKYLLFYPQRNQQTLSNTVRNVDGKLNDAVVINKRNSLGLSKPLPIGELKNTKVISKPLPTINLSKTTSQLPDKTTRVNRKKRTSATQAIDSFTKLSNLNTSEDQSQLIKGSRYAKIDSPLTVTSTITPATTLSKDVSPPHMAEADIVAAVQASIRLTEDVSNHNQHQHHQARKKHAQRISSRITGNSSSPSSTSGPDVEGSYYKDKERNLKSGINILYQNHSSLSVNLKYKSDSVNGIFDSQRDHYNEKNSSVSNILPVTTFQKQYIDELNDEFEPSVILQGTNGTINQKSSTSTLLAASFDNSQPIVDECFEWPENTETYIIQSNDMHQFNNDLYNPSIWPVWDDSVTDLHTCWNQTRVFSDNSVPIGSDEAMNRLSEETHEFSKSFFSELSNMSSLYSSQSIPLSWHSKVSYNNIHWTDQPCRFKLDRFNEKFMSEDTIDPCLNLFDTIQSAHNNNDNNDNDKGNNDTICGDYLPFMNSPEYLSSNEVIECCNYQETDCYFYVNKTIIEEALNATLPVVYSILLRNNNCDDTVRIDNSLITQIFLNALYTASSNNDNTNQPVGDEIDHPSYYYHHYCPNSMGLQDLNVSIITPPEGSIKYSQSLSTSSARISRENSTDYHENTDNDDDDNGNNSKYNFYELLQMTAARRLSVINYETTQLDDYYIEEKLKALHDEYFGFVLNPLDSVAVINHLNKDRIITSSWKSVTDIPQSELFEEFGLCEVTTTNHSTSVDSSSNSVNYKKIFEESSAIAPWTYILEKSNNPTHVDNNNNSNSIHNEDILPNSECTNVTTTVCTLDSEMPK
ncbi:unnamed protein product [Trichobilharzia szidati]|nr:unnamed protein product [Trichobilharzia szidati]